MVKVKGEYLTKSSFETIIYITQEITAPKISKLPKVFPETPVCVAAGPKVTIRDPKNPTATPKTLITVGASLKIKLAAIAFTKGTVAKIAAEVEAEVKERPDIKKIAFKAEPKKPTAIKRGISDLEILWCFMLKKNGNRIKRAKKVLKKAKEKAGTSPKPILVTTGPNPQKKDVPSNAKRPSFLCDISKAYNNTIVIKS